jgi:hypothetical protein
MNSTSKMPISIMKKKHNKSNKRVSFGQISVRHITPYKSENKSNTITNRELEQAKQEARIEKNEQKKKEKEIKEIKDQYIAFLKKQELEQEQEKGKQDTNKEKDVLNDKTIAFNKRYSKYINKSLRKQYGFGGNPRLYTRKRGRKNNKTVKVTIIRRVGTKSKHQQTQNNTQTKSNT